MVFCADYLIEKFNHRIVKEVVDLFVRIYNKKSWTDESHDLVSSISGSYVMKKRSIIQLVHIDHVSYACL